MKLIQFSVSEDFGKEYCLVLLKMKNYSLLQLEVSIGEYSDWFELPYIQICSGYGRLFSFLFTVSRFGFTFDIFSRNWVDKE
jgi:hypothetical protein